MDITVIVAILLTLVVLIVSLVAIFRRDSYSADANAKMVDATVGLMERLEADNTLLRSLNASLRRELRAWKHAFFALREQLWRLGHDPEVDEPSSNSEASVDFDTQLATALIAAFDLAAFDRLLLTIGKRREDISTAESKTQIVYDVVELAERENWLDDLRRAALAANPHNEQLKRAVDAN